MQAAPKRQSVDLSDYPDLVMIMLGFRLKGLRGFSALRKIGPGLNKVMRAYPDGLLLHEGMMFSLMHLGFRQYWRDLDALEHFTRSEPHAAWWKQVRDLSAHAGFWHETYHARGGVEAVYVEMPVPVGLLRFAPERKPVGALMSARSRIQDSSAGIEMA